MKTLSHSVQSFAAFVLALAILAIGAVVGIAFLGLALLVGLGTAVAVKLSGQRRMPTHDQRNPKKRVWNDGRGPIIDM